MTKIQNEGFLALVQQSITLIPPDTINRDDDEAATFNTPSIPYLKGNLHKICFAKKRLRASLQHWINSKVGNARCLSSPSAYLERARADGYLMTSNKTVSEDDSSVQPEADVPNIPNPHKLLNSNNMHDFVDVSIMDPETFLDVYHEGILYLGVIVDQKEHLGHDPNSLMDSPSILMCAARLYRHLLWRRTFLAQLEATTACGFAVTCGQGPSGDFLAVYKLEMNLSSGSSLIGSRVPVSVAMKHASISITGSQSALDLLHDLGIFLLKPRADFAKVKLHDNHPSSSSTFLYPGPAMLLPEGMTRKLQQEKARNCETNITNPAQRYKVMPTITGSLVIRCNDLAAAEETFSLDLLSIDSDVVVPTDSWYVKCKTPLLYGPFWETSKVAINGTRRRLQLLLGQHKKHGLSDRHVQVGKDWLFMHPLDAIHEPHRSLIVVREMGHVFRGQLSWKGFVVAFGSLLHDTLVLQNMVQLVHGDIHAGNVLLYDPLNHSGKPPQLILVDWDEASREKPFHRNTKTEKEKRQYPAALINFPDLYTKHQLQELFEYYTNAYYSEHAEVWSNFQTERDPNNEQGFQGTVRYRHKMLGAFLSLHRTE